LLLSWPDRQVCESFTRRVWFHPEQLQKTKLKILLQQLEQPTKTAVTGSELRNGFLCSSSFVKNTDNIYNFR